MVVPLRVSQKVVELTRRFVGRQRFMFGSVPAFDNACCFAAPLSLTAAENNYKAIASSVSRIGILPQEATVDPGEAFLRRHADS